MIAALAFYVFAALLLGSAALVVTARNPVHSVLFLILAFFNAAALFLLAGAEFLAMILVIVYVGAVAVLFLFVVMMLDVDFIRLREGYQKYTPIGAAVGVVLLAELAMMFSVWQVSPGAAKLLGSPIPAGISNTDAIGRVIYTDYILLFQAAGLVLLVAMIGAIVLTLRGKPGSRRQRIADQVARDPAQTMVLVQVETGAGIGPDKYLTKTVEAAPALEAAHGHGHDHGHGGH